MKHVLFLMLNNEVPLLLDRLHYDERIFDAVYVGEATKTFAGRPKPLFFERYKDNFQQFKKLHYQVVTDLPDPDRSREYIGTNGLAVKENRWVVEYAMRNYPMRLLANLSTELGEDYLITVADVDEIVNANSLPTDLAFDEVHRYYMWDFRESLEIKGRKEHPIVGPFTTRYSTLNRNKLTLSDVRRLHHRSDGQVVGSSVVSPGSLRNLDGTPAYPLREFPRISLSFVRDADRLGWHLSNMNGGYRAILGAKAEMFAHSEYSKLRPNDAFEVPDIWEKMNTLGSNEPVEALARLAPEAPTFITNSAKFLRYYLPD